MNSPRVPRQESAPAVAVDLRAGRANNPNLSRGERFLLYFGLGGKYYDVIEGRYTTLWDKVSAVACRKSRLRPQRLLFCVLFRSYGEIKVLRIS